MMKRFCVFAHRAKLISLAALFLQACSVNTNGLLDSSPSASALDPASATLSGLTASRTSVLADGVTTTLLTATLRDASLKPLSGKTVILTSSRAASDVISMASGSSSSSGVVTFTVKSTVVGSSTYTATDTTDSVAITQTSSVTFTAAPPGAFTIAPATLGDGGVILSWNASPNATSYTVVYGTTNAYGATASTNASSPLIIRGLTNGTNYHFLVKAVNAIGTTNATTEITAIPAVQTYVYLDANASNSSVVGSVVQCTTNLTTGAFSNCVNNNANASWNPNNADGIAFTALSGVSYGYVTDTNNGNVWSCSVDQVTGLFISCSITGSGWSSPKSIAVTTLSGSTYAYVSDYHSNYLWLCNVSAGDGSLNNCTYADGGINSWSPNASAVITYSGTTYGFVADDDGAIWSCQVDTSNGTFNTCSMTNNGVGNWDAPHSLRVQAFGGVSYLFINDDDGIYQCTLGSGGTLACAYNTTFPIGSQASSVFLPINGVIQSYSENNSDAYLCSINQSTGLFGQCNLNDGTWTLPGPIAGIAVYAP